MFIREKSNLKMFTKKKLPMLLKIELKTFTCLTLINNMLKRYSIKKLMVIHNNQNNYITLLAFIYNRCQQTAACGQNADLKVKTCL